MKDTIVTDKDRKRLATIRGMLTIGAQPYSQGEPVQRPKPEVKPEPTEDYRLVAKWARRSVKGTLEGQKTIVVKAGVEPISNSRCVKCGVEVNPTFSERAKVLESFSFIMRDRTELHPVTLETLSVKPQFVPVVRYVTGYVCDKCGSEYRTVVSKHGVRAQIVQIIPSFRMVPRDGTDGAKTYRGFGRTIRVQTGKDTLSSQRAIKQRV